MGRKVVLTPPARAKRATRQRTPLGLARHKFCIRDGEPGLPVLLAVGTHPVAMRIAALKFPVTYGAMTIRFVRRNRCAESLATDDG